ncbi:MAG: M20/M25/M40 family metallo-hydrolase [Deltaproteobacteria bacterium]
MSRARKSWLMIAVAFLLFLLAGGGVMLITKMPLASYRDPLPPLTASEIRIEENLSRHVRMLADSIGERNIWRSGSLAKTARFIEDTFTRLGYTVERMEFTSRKVTVSNLAVELRGSKEPGEIIVIGAHYDSVAHCPGANDNGSGVAALLELARLLHDAKPERTVRFVAFVNEESPFFLRGEMGSRRYAARCRKLGENIVAMFSLETIGFYSDQPRSQRYPFPFSFFYPDTGNFIAFVANLDSRHLVRQAIAAFRRYTRFPSEGTAAPGWLTGISWSDHASFWREGYPAVMITDTAPFRYAAYHRPNDTPEKLDYGRMARAVGGLGKMVEELARNQ